MRISLRYQHDIGLQKIFIPPRVTKIGYESFKGCTSLEEVVIPSSVKEINRTAFDGCNNIKAIYVPKEKVDFYKERFPADMHWLIVEEGSDFPMKP